MIQDTEAGVSVVLQGALTLRTIEAVRTTLRAAIEPSPGAATVSIDCSAATEIDLSFVQLLIGTRISAHLLGKEVSLSAAPDGALLDTLTRGGFRVLCESGACSSRPRDASAFWFAGAEA